MDTVQLNVNGMHCVSCAMLIDEEIEAVPGVKQSSTSYAKQTAEVTYDPAVADLDSLFAAVSAAGYSATLPGDMSGRHSTHLHDTAGHARASGRPSAESPRVPERNVMPRTNAMRMLRMCLNPKMLVGLAVIGIGVFLFAPNLLLAAIPLLLFAACPLSMLVMGGAMMGRRRSQEGAGQSGASAEPSKQEGAPLN